MNYVWRWVILFCGLFVLSNIANAKTDVLKSVVEHAPEIVIQDGMLGRPSHMALQHEKDASFLEIFHQHEEQLWRREKGEKEWKVFRHWKNRSRTSYHSDHGKVIYDTVVNDGKLSIYDSHTWQQVAEITIPYGVHSLPGIYFPPSKASFRILKVPTYDTDGRKIVLVYFSEDGHVWKEQRDLGLDEALQSFWEIRPGFYAAHRLSGNYLIYQVGHKGLTQYKKLPHAFKKIDRLTWLGDDSLAVGEKFRDPDVNDKKDTGLRWRLYHWNAKKGWLSIQKDIAKEPEEIKSVSRIGTDFFRITERESTSHALLDANLVFYDNHTGKITRFTDKFPEAPKYLQYLKVLAKNTVIGFREHDDLDRDGSPGTWTWMMKSSQGKWMGLTQLLPDKHDFIWDVVAWHDGNGLGIQSVNSENHQRTWRWFLRDKDGAWQGVSKLIPELENVQITKVKDVRDGLVGFVEDGKVVSSPEPGSRITLEDLKTHWYMQTEDGSWVSVNQLVYNLHPTSKGKIFSVDARKNSLIVKVEIHPGEAASKFLLYRERNGQWLDMDRSFYRSKKTSSYAMLPRARANVDISNGVVSLERELLSTWYTDDDGSQNKVLYRYEGAWQFIQGLNAAGHMPLDYDGNRKLLIRNARVSNEKAFFLLTQSNGWVDVRKLFPEAPNVVGDAFSYLHGQGIAIREYDDENGNGRPFEWSFRIHSKTGWVPLASQLPEIQGEIVNVIGVGGGILAVQIDDSWSYFAQHKKGWFNVQKSLPQFASKLVNVHVSQDGLVLTAQEELDANGNGKYGEFFIAVRKGVSEYFRDVSSILPNFAREEAIEAVSLDGGLGIAIEFTQSLKSLKVASKLVDDSHWNLFYWENNKLKPMRGLPKKVIDFKLHPNGEWAMFKDGDGTWKLFSRHGAGDIYRAFSTSLVVNSAIRDVVFDPNSHFLGLKMADQILDSQDRWEWWKLDHKKAAISMGHTSTSSWWSYDTVSKISGRTQFDSAYQTLDGELVENIPTPEVWIHADKSLGDKGHMIYAPEILKRVLGLPQNMSDVEVDAFGLGRGGSVILYRMGSKKYVTAFSNGTLRIDSRKGQFSNGVDKLEKSIHFFVNQNDNGEMRYVRLDEPTRWLWLFGEGNDLIYFDDKGHFYSDSTSISSKISFRKGLDIFSFEQFGSVLFRPDLLEDKLGLKQGSFFKLTQRDEERMTHAKTLALQGVGVTTALPPSLKISKVPDKTSNPYIEVNISADGFGVDEGSVVATILGAGRARGGAVRGHGSKQVKISVTKKVPLIRGLNLVKLTVYDANGLESSKVVNVEYTPKNDHKPTLWVAILATKDYSSPQLSSLPLTQSDAQTIQHLVEQQSGKIFDHVELQSWCQNKSCDRQPTYSEIIEELPSFLGKAKNGDYIEIFVSGHGVKLDKEFYIVPADGNLQSKQNLISWTMLQTWLQSAALGRKIVFLDTCQSGAVFGSDQDKRRMIQQSVENDGIYVLSATAADASAYELSEVGNGLFTYVVKEGMNGGAATNSDGLVSFENLSFFLARRVRELSTLHHVRMEPYLPILKREWDFDLAAVDRKSRLFLHVTDISSFDGSASLSRFKAWKKSLNDLGILVVDGKAEARIRLNIVEDNGKILRARLSNVDQDILAQWSFQKTKQPLMLSQLKMRIEHE